MKNYEKLRFRAYPKINAFSMLFPGFFYAFSMLFPGFFRGFSAPHQMEVLRDFMKNTRNRKLQKVLQDRLYMRECLIPYWKIDDFEFRRVGRGSVGRVWGV